MKRKSIIVLVIIIVLSSQFLFVYGEEEEDLPRLLSITFGERDFSGDYVFLP